MAHKIDGYTLEMNRDDRGRIVAEVWHDATGKTLGITEVDNYEMGRWWGCKLINTQLEQQKANAS